MKTYCRLMAALLFSSLADAEVVVVAGASSPLSALSKQEVSNIYLGKTRALPNGQEAMPLDLPEDQEARVEFLNAITGKTEVQYKAYWARMVFSGAGRPPKLAANASKTKALLANNPNAIGYISKDDLDASVKVLLQP